jgi:hypothetical protein
MNAHSPNAALLSGFAISARLQCVTSGGDQRQAPVAAEKQRRVMRLRISPVTCSPFDLMRQLSKTTLSQLQISDTPPNWSMKWLSNFVAPAHLPFYARNRKRIEPSREATLSRAARNLLMTVCLPHNSSFYDSYFADALRISGRKNISLASPHRSETMQSSATISENAIVIFRQRLTHRFGLVVIAAFSLMNRRVLFICFASPPTVCGRFLS